MARNVSRRELLRMIGTVASMSLGGAALAACGATPTAQAPTPTAQAPTPTEAAAQEPTPSAVAQAEEPTKAPQAEVTLRYWTWTTDRVEAYRSVFDAFQERQADIKIEIETFGFGDYWTKLQSSFVGGVACDFFLNGPAQSRLMMKQGTILNTTPLVERDAYDVGAFYPNVAEMFSFEGNLYGMPESVESEAMAYNKDMFDSAGAPYPESDWAWNPQDGGDLVKVLEAVTLDANGKHPNESDFDAENIKQYGLAMATSGYEFWHFIPMGGGQWLDKQFDGTKCLLNSPENVATVQFFQDLMYRYHVAVPGAALDSGGGDQKLFMGGQAAMYQMGVWAIAALREGVSFPWDVVELPAGPAGRVIRSIGLAFSAWSGSKHLDQTWEVLKWLGGKEAQDSLGASLVLVPARKESGDAWLKAVGNSPEHVAAFLGQLDRTMTEPMVVGFDEMSKAYVEELSLVALNEKDAAAAVADWAAKTERVLAEQQG